MPTAVRRHSSAIRTKIAHVTGIASEARRGSPHCTGSSLKCGTLGRSHARCAAPTSHVGAARQEPLSWSGPRFRVLPRVGAAVCLSCGRARALGSYRRSWQFSMLNIKKTTTSFTKRFSMCFSGPSRATASPLPRFHAPVLSCFLASMHPCFPASLPSVLFMSYPVRTHACGPHCGP